MRDRQGKALKKADVILAVMEMCALACIACAAFAFEFAGRLVNRK